MSQPTGSTSALEQAVRRVRITAQVSALVFVIALFILMTGGTVAAGPVGTLVLVLAVYGAGFVLLVSSIGTVVGWLLLAAQRDQRRGTLGTDAPENPSTNWWQ